MKILLTNDDSIRALGIKTLYQALKDAGHEVSLVAPMRQQSAVGQGLTVFEPVRVKPYAEGDYQGIAVYGTPTACVKLALGHLVKKPDLVISGINLGANVGPDLLYSGTVAAAIEAAASGFAALALSLDDHKAKNVSQQAKHAVSLLPQIPWDKFKGRRVINVNYPKIPFSQNKGLKICPHALALWENSYEERKDPRDDSYYWLDGDIDTSTVANDTDCYYLSQGYITLTPLKINFNDPEGLNLLKDLTLA